MGPQYQAQCRRLLLPEQVIDAARAQAKAALERPRAWIAACAIVGIWIALVAGFGCWLVAVSG